MYTASVGAPLGRPRRRGLAPPKTAHFTCRGTGTTKNLISLSRAVAEYMVSKLMCVMFLGGATRSVLLHVGCGLPTSQ